MKIHLIVGARPNIVKIAPLYHVLKTKPWADLSIIHAGQHYDNDMSDIFFKDFCLPNPDIKLGVGKGTHATQTGKIMMKYEACLISERPDLVIVVGDVNATMAAALTAVKLEISVAHIEAGLRSFDRTMPEEINRIVTDAVSDFLLTPSYDADENLLREGISDEKIKRVGNIMIDTLVMLKHKIAQSNTIKRFNLVKRQFGIVTFHRPINVDKPAVLHKICETLIRLSKRIKLVFPLHPRTKKNLHKYNLIDYLSNNSNMIITNPLPYIRFLNLVMNSSIVITDSGGVQEETTYLQIPCITVRDNTERPITILQGTNKLSKIDNIDENVFNALDKKDVSYNIPAMWDGNTSNRIVQFLESLI